MNMDSVYVEIQQAINGGTIFSLPRKKLEQFVAALGRSQAFAHFDAAGFHSMCETARLALALKISEEANLHAGRESRLALVIAVFALLAGLVQAAVVLWQFFVPSAIQVNAPAAVPIHVAPIAPAPPSK